MKTKDIILLILLSTLVIGCKENTKFVRYTYYDSGEIKEKIIYQEKNNSNDYIAYLYNKEADLIKERQFKNDKANGIAYDYYLNGNIKNRYSFLNGVMHGVIYNFNPDSTLKSTAIYNNDKPHGVTTYYSKTKRPKAELFFYKGKGIIQKRYFRTQDDKIIKIENSNIFNIDSTYEMGPIVYRKDNAQFIEEASQMYVVFIKPDTIKVNNKLQVKVKFINKYSWKLKLELGDFDESMRLINNKGVYSGRDSLIFETSSSILGNNLLTGKLTVELDTMVDGQKLQVMQKHIFYKDFFVN